MGMHLESQNVVRISMERVEVGLEVDLE